MTRQCFPLYRAAGLIAAMSASAVFAACSDQPLTPSVVPATSSEQRVALETAAAAPEYADVLNQGGAGVYAAGGATLVRQPNGLRLSVTMPTPEPGTYVYAPSRPDAGHPEVFTLWAFVFNYPDKCNGPCDGDDLGANTPAKGGVHNVGGHTASGGSLTIAGDVTIGEAPFAPATAPLESPRTAEIHLAVAPHGVLDPSKLPAEFGLPTGSPMCGCWWVAIFK